MNLELFLFSVDPNQIALAEKAGIAGIVVDWESKGKKERQSGADTQINHHTLADLKRARAATKTRVLCRINRFSQKTKQELEDAIEAGADEVFLPMVESPAEVEEALAQAAGRVEIGILLETNRALAQASELGKLPLSRVFVGLNDLAIERQSSSIFLPLVDGTIDEARPFFSVPFGFGGLTLPGQGFPIPCSLLVQEMIRLQCSFTFLRRSFLKDMRGKDFCVEVPRMREWISHLSQHSFLEQETLRHQFVDLVTS